MFGFRANNNVGSASQFGGRCLVIFQFCCWRQWAVSGGQGLDDADGPRPRRQRCSIGKPHNCVPWRTLSYVKYFNHTHLFTCKIQNSFNNPQYNYFMS